MDTSEVIAHYLDHRKMRSQELAEAVGVSKRQIERYIAGDQNPPLRIAARIAETLGISLLELAGRTPTEPGLSGIWFASNQSWKDDVERIDTSEVHITQDGNYLLMDSGRAQGEQALELGDYAWVSELKFDASTSTIVGEWSSNDGAVRTRGSYYFWLHPQGQLMIGRWAGSDYDGPEVSGRIVLARSKDEAEQQLLAIKDIPGNIRTWPPTNTE